MLFDLAVFLRRLRHADVGAAGSHPTYSLLHDCVAERSMAGHGRNGQVFAAVNPHFPNIVLKRSHFSLIEDEADKLWQMDHPNIVRMHAFVDSHEVQFDGNPAAYLMLDKLGPSLGSLLLNAVKR